MPMKNHTNETRASVARLFSVFMFVVLAHVWLNVPNSQTEGVAQSNKKLEPRSLTLRHHRHLSDTRQYRYR